MKLIDLLVQELPKRGGWPEGIKAIEQNVSGYLFDSLCPRDPFLFNKHGFEITDEWRTEIVTSKQYEAALAASQKVEWDGEGLPPVGCECEGKQFAQINWTKFTVVAIANDHVFGFWNDNVAVGLSHKMWEFRPIRSESDKKREIGVTALALAMGDPPFIYGQRMNDGRLVAYGVYELYDKIAAGEVEGIRIE